MATIDSGQDYDVIHTLTFNSGSGTCAIRLYRGSTTAYSGTVYYRAGTSGEWTELSVSGTTTTFPASSTTMQVGHSNNKDGDHYMTVSFYGQSTNLTGVAISQKAVYSGAVGDYFWTYYVRDCAALTSIDVPDTSGVTSAGDGFASYYVYGCTSITSLAAPDTGSITSVGQYFFYSHANGCTSLTTADVPDTSSLTSAGDYFLYWYVRGCTSLISVGVPDTSGLTSVGYRFFYGYAYGCTSLTSLAAPDTGSITSVGDYCMYSYASHCTSLTSLGIPDTSSLTSVGSNFMEYYATDCDALLRLELPAAGWFVGHNINWSVPSARLNYLKGYVGNSTDQTAWQALTVSTKTLYINYIRSSDDVILEESGVTLFGGTWGMIT